jgi:hypothetical protein
MPKNNPTLPDPANANSRAHIGIAAGCGSHWSRKKRTQLTQGNRAERLRLFDARAPHLDAATWEELCRAAVPRMAAGLGAGFGPASRYWGGSGPEWDVVAKAGSAHLLGEVKWMAKAPTAAELMAIYGQLLAKGRPPFVHGEIVHALFVPALPRSRPRGLPANVRMVDARAVVEALRPQ